MALNDVSAAYPDVHAWHREARPTPVPRYSGSHYHSTSMRVAPNERRSRRPYSSGPQIVASAHRITIAGGPPRRVRSGMSPPEGSGRAIRRAIHQAATGRVTGPIVRAARASWPPTARTSSPRAVRGGKASRRRSIATPGTSSTPPDIASTPGPRNPERRGRVTLRADLSGDSCLGLRNPGSQAGTAR
jgi:hypothetical protein